MYSQLCLEEREKIFAWDMQGLSLRDIGRKLDRSDTTIGRELKRNKLLTRGMEKLSGEYIPCRAQEKADKRTVTQRSQASWKGPGVYLYVRDHLIGDGWSPEQIAGRYCLDNPGEKLTHETIYAVIYAKENRKEKLWQYLHRQRKSRRKTHGRQVHRESRIPEAVSIDKRPKVVGRRKQIGHWETDNVIGKQTDKTALSVTVERKIKIAIVSKVKKTAADKAHKLVGRMSKLPKVLRRTMTADNGSENTDHKDITQSLDMRMYFCHAYHSWERGTVENTNGRLRYFIPKGISIDSIDEETIQKIEWKLNNTPRKCLGFKTPLEVLEEIMHNIKTSDRCTSR